MGEDYTSMIQEALIQLSKRMFTDEFLNQLLNNQYREFIARGDDGTDADLKAARQALPSILGDKGMTALGKWEQLFHQQAKYQAEQAFQSGCFATFRYYFTPNPGHNAFDSLLNPSSITKNNIESDTLNQSILQFQEALAAPLTANGQEHILSIACAWEQWIYGVQRHSFYLGCSYAASIIRSFTQEDGQEKLTEWMQNTESGLGFTLNRENR